MMRRSARTGAAVLLGGLLASCASTSVQAPPTVTPSDACVQEFGANPAVLRVGLTHPVDVAHAPVPHNAGERLLFRQLYETLVTVDCSGAVVPQLAESWTLQGNTWEFRLNEDARFTDGSPVTAQAVLTSWTGRELPRAITGISARGNHALRVVVADSFDVAFFADPVFGVARTDATSSWPIGSTTFRAASDSVIRLRSADGREIVFQQTKDEISALDRGVDALIARDEATLGYARVLTGYHVTELPWSQTYVFASGSVPADSARDPATVHRWLRDAVTAETRPAQSYYWWREQRCMNLKSVPNTQNIGILKDDAISRALADRLSALAWQAKFETNGFVLPIPNVPACGVAFPQAQLTPLLETRDLLVHRANIGRIRILGDGTVQFDGGQR